jgi:hypothetical protein
MKRTLYIPFSVCILMLSACSGDLPEQQAEKPCALQLNFKPEGEATITRADGALITENGTLEAIGLCITKGIGYDAYPDRNDTRFTFHTDGSGLYEGSNPSATTIYLTGETAHIQAFSPSSATASQTGSGNGYTIPVTLPAEQTFSTTGTPATPTCDATDYLYGSAGSTVGDATAITASANGASSVDIYMHHALAKIMFTLQCDKDRTPNTEYDCVKSIKISAPSGSTPFLTGATGNSNSKMQINNGQISGLTNTYALTFTAATGSTPIAMGANGNPTIVACGLVAPLSNNLSGDFTITVTLGKNGETTHDRTYTGISKVFTQKWLAGYYYTYHLVLGGSTLCIDNTTVEWGKIDSQTNLATEEQGIGSAEELWAFAKKWNEDENPSGNLGAYEEYGWTEKGVFKIKLTGPITITGTTDKEKWTPIGTDTKPLTIPFDGQGWTINVDLTGLGTGGSGTQQTIPTAYAGIIGHTTSDISNVKIMTSGAASAAIEFPDAIYAGMLAGKVKGNITNCTVELNGITLLQKNESAASGLYFGGLVGSCEGDIINSAVYAKGTNELKLSFTKASTSSCVGGLAGAVVGTVNNCYTRITELSNQDAENGKPSAGSLVGNVTGSGESAVATFANCHYIENTTSPATGITVTNCTRKEPDNGALTQTDFNGLCTALNTISQITQSWATWTEENTNVSGVETVVSVFLFSYRGTPENNK